MVQNVGSLLAFSVARFAGFPSEIGYYKVDISMGVNTLLALTKEARRHEGCEAPRSLERK